MNQPTSPLHITPNQLTLAQLRALWQAPQTIELDASCHAQIDQSARCIADIVARDKPAYGVNTGFGLLAKQHIPRADLAQLQTNLILSHAVGTGEASRPEVVRLIMLMKIASLAQGYSGVRPIIINTLIAMLNADILPVIPEKGSVGASGDLAPLAHMTLAMLGIGKVMIHQGTKRCDAAEALAKSGIAPVQLGPKEGLALINGTQVSTAFALHGLFMAERVFSSAVITGAMSVDAAKGSDAPFDARIHQIRGQRGQIKVAALYRALLTGSMIRQSHLDYDDRVQDPYSLRCQPQVMGACWDLITQARHTLLIEANAVTDNPLIFTHHGNTDTSENTADVISGGNFHAEPVAFAADTLALAIAEIGALSERRIALLIDTHLSGLPPFLVENPGLNSGFMIAHVTAAALASENKSLAHPASVDSLPTSANQEDHVSMATFAGRRLHDMAHHSATIIAIELLAAAQGIDFHRPLRSSPFLETLHEQLRLRVARYGNDRLFAPDIEAAKQWIVDGDMHHHLIQKYPEWAD